MDDFDGLYEEPKADRKPRPKHPRGWEPGAVLDGEGEGFLVSRPRKLEGVVKPEAEPWEDHLRKAGLDPLKVEVIPPVEVRTWDAAIGGGEVQTMVYFKAKIRARTSQTLDPELYKWILKWKPKSKAQRLNSEENNSTSVVVPWGDWQLGKGDGDGTDGTIRRILDGFDQTVDYISRQKPTQIVVASLGDLIENCAGHYAQQTFRADRNVRDQENTARRLATAGIKAFADICPVVVLPVGGNHGEVRMNGASFTDFADNVDVGLYEPVADQLAENPRFDNVRFHIPQADLTQTIDLHGHVLGLFHGHQVRGAGDKVANWWKGQMKARAPIGDADIILNGHFHSLIVRSVGPRTHIQIPAVDGGSDWFDQTSGGGDPAGQVVFTVSDDGWDRLRVFELSRS